MRRCIVGILLAISILALGVSGYLLADMAIQEHRDDALLEEIRKVHRGHGAGKDPGAASVPVVDPGLLALHGENPDCIGWLRIEGTQIDYPVMYHPGEKDYYLHRDFNGEYSANGCLFLSEICDPGTDDNAVIYGHHMRSGKMFAALEQYKDREFYQGHPLVSYDTLQGRGDYQILAVFCTPVYTGSDFPYHTFIRAGDAQEYQGYIRAVRERSLYDTGVDAVFGDRLLVLSTCEYSQANGRIVVVAKEIQQTE